MSIRIVYEDPAAIAGMSQAAGYGEYRRQQNQQDLQWAQLAQNAQQHRDSINAQLFSQGMQNQANQNAQLFNAQRQAAIDQQHMGFQNQLQQQQQKAIEDHYKYTTQYGQYGQQMLSIDKALERGLTYSEDQQKLVDSLDGAMQKVRLDPSAGQEQKQQAYENWVSQKSQIMPNKPAPPPAQDTLNKNIVKYTHPDGTEVAGVLGSRNGSVEFKPIENPNQKQQDKIAIVQQQLEQKQTLHQQDLEFKQKEHQLQMAADQQKVMMQIEQHRLQMTALQKKELDAAYHKLQGENANLQKKSGDILATPEQKAQYQKQIEQNNTMFRNMHGQDLAAHAPNVASEMGIEFQQTPSQPAPSAPSPYAPQTTPGGWQPQPAPGQPAAPQAPQQPPKSPQEVVQRVKSLPFQEQFMSQANGDIVTVNDKGTDFRPATDEELKKLHPDHDPADVRRMGKMRAAGGPGQPKMYGTDKEELAKQWALIPSGAEFYDTEGKLRRKP